MEGMFNERREVSDVSGQRFVNRLGGFFSRSVHAADLGSWVLTVPRLSFDTLRGLHNGDGSLESRLLKRGVIES